MPEPWWAPEIINYMTIYLGADHRGFKLKEKLKKVLQRNGYVVRDYGAFAYDKDDDYTDFAISVARAVVQNHRGARGVLVCGSGVGMAIMANKIKGIRAALASSVTQAIASRHDSDANVLVLAADFLKEKDARAITLAWLRAPFVKKPRYLRRLQKISQTEKSLK